MAKTLKDPWIAGCVHGLLTVPTSAQHQHQHNELSQYYYKNLKPKVVQVIRTYEEVNILIVNDTKHAISVMLSPACVERFYEENNNQRLAILQNSIIKLEDWHFSTVIQCLGAKSLEQVKSLGICFPIAINCAKLQSLGAFDSAIVGVPIDINHDQEIRKKLSDMMYITMVSRFVGHQFPEHGQLPDNNGFFKIPKQYDDNNIIILESHCKIPADQYQVIKHKLRNLNNHDEAEQHTLISDTECTPNYDYTLVEDTQKYSPIGPQENLNGFGDHDYDEGERKRLRTAKGEEEENHTPKHSYLVASAMIPIENSKSLNEKQDECGRTVLSSPPPQQISVKSESEERSDAVHIETLFTDSMLYTQASSIENMSQLIKCHNELPGLETQKDENEDIQTQLQEEGQTPYSTVDSIKVEENTVDHTLIGKKVARSFNGHNRFIGLIVSYNRLMFRVKYDDGDDEELSYAEALDGIREYESYKRNDSSSRISREANTQVSKAIRMGMKYLFGIDS